MRVLKFRAWTGKEMISADEMGRDELTLAVNGRGFVNVNSVNTKLSEYYGHLVPMQYTGYKDRDGVEVYDGDVVVWEQAPGGVLESLKDQQAYTCGGEWSQFMAGWSCKHASSTSRFTFASSHMKVIGNVYANPGLLEVSA